jgi:hypothetical protein
MEEMIGTGLIAVSEVQAIRVQKQAVPPDEKHD